MRATGQPKSLNGSLTEPERRLVAARAILGEWLAGSGGGWQSWWQRESEAEERALYIHIPFCRKRCSFCNFFENGANPARINRYVNALCASLAQAADTPLAQSMPFSAV